MVHNSMQSAGLGLVLRARRYRAVGDVRVVLMGVYVRMKSAPDFFRNMSGVHAYGIAANRSRTLLLEACLEDASRRLWGSDDRGRARGRAYVYSYQLRPCFFVSLVT